MLDRTEGAGDRRGRARPRPGGDRHLWLRSSAQRRGGARSRPPRSKLQAPLLNEEKQVQQFQRIGVREETNNCMYRIYLYFQKAAMEGWTKANDVCRAREGEGWDGAARHLQMCLGLRFENCVNAFHGDKM